MRIVRGGISALISLEGFYTTLHIRFLSVECLYEVTATVAPLC